MTSVCNKGAQEGCLQKRNMYHICVFDHQRIWASYTIGLISMCKNHEQFFEKVKICTLYSTIFNIPHMTGFISLLLMQFLEQISTGTLLCTIKSQADRI